MGKLTDIEIRQWIASGSPVVKSDGGGLAFTMSAKQAAAKSGTWVLRYRIGGKEKELTLGRYPDMRLKDARELAADKRLQVQKGVDVAAVKKTEKQFIKNAPADLIVSDLFKEFYDRNIKNQWKDADSVQQVFDLHILPKIGNVKVADVRTPHIESTLRPLVERGVKATAAKVLQHLKRLFNDAVILQLIEFNPAASFSRKHTGGKLGSRSRVLSRSELTALFAAMNNTPNFPPYVRAAVKLLLLLGVRKSELIQAKWDEFDLNNAVWRIPAERTKTEAPIRIPLALSAVIELEALKLKSWNGYVFPAHRMSPGKTTGYMGDVTINQALYRLQSGIEAFVVHDLRRTCRTQLSELGIPPHIAEMCLNHKPKGLIAVYDVHDYFEDRRQALETWAAVLSECEAGEISSTSSPRI